MSSVRFLQISDLHLDCALTGSRLGYGIAKRARLKKDMEAAIVKAMNIVRTQSIDVVLCPGDLWDDEGVSITAASFLYEAFASIAPIPVLIAPGNHDPYNAFSYHHPKYYRMKTGKPHPGNVTVFNCNRIEPRVVASLPGVDFYGCCFEQNVPRTERILRNVRPQRHDAVNVLLLHGTRDDNMGAIAGKEVAAPFSAEELLTCGFDYAALGHHHGFATIADEEGRIRGAYSGIPVARGLDERNPHFALTGTIGKGGVEDLHTLDLDLRRIVAVEVQIDATLTNNTATQTRVDAALSLAGVGPDDICYVKLQGRTHPLVIGFEFDTEWQDSRCFHMVIDQSGLEPEYDIDRLLGDETSEKRIEGSFVRRMKDLLDKCDGDRESARLVRSALCYGLDALRNQEVKPRNVH